MDEFNGIVDFMKEEEIKKKIEDRQIDGKNQQVIMEDFESGQLH